MRLDYNELKAKLDVSPLELGNVLIQQELHDQKKALEVLAEIDEELKGRKDIVDGLLVPIFYTVIDNKLAKSSLMKSSNADQFNITASRVIEECKSFRYETEAAESYGDKSLSVQLDDYAEGRIVRGRSEYNRHDYEDKKKLEDYLHSKTNDGMNKTAKDEYSEGRVYARKSDLQQRSFHEHNKHMANVDHIVPLHEKYGELKENYALSKSEITEIVNSEANLAITNGHLNQSKRDLTNSEYVERNKHKLDDLTRQNMLAKESAANQAMEEMQNARVSHKLLNTTSERNRIVSRAGRDSLKASITDTKDNAIGTVIIEFIKVTYYELTDIFKNGMCHRTGESSKLGALKARLRRAVKHVINRCRNLTNILGDFITGFVKALFNAIFNLFAGVIKNGWNIIKGGFSSIIQAVKIILKPSEEMSGAEKCDAIMKLAAATAVMILGESLESYLNISGLGAFGEFLKPIFSGVLSVVVVFLLDKIDIFGAAIERKRRRVKEVFEARIADIQYNVATFNKAAMETLLHQRQCFDQLMVSFTRFDKNDDLDGMTVTSVQMTKFFNVDLDYKDEDEFAAMLAQEGNLKF